MITFNCECGQGMKVPLEWAGKRVKCRKCGTSAVVPMPEATDLATPAAAPAAAHAPVAGTTAPRSAPHTSVGAHSLPPQAPRTAARAYAEPRLQRAGTLGGENVPGQVLGKPRNVWWFFGISVAWLIYSVAAFFVIRDDLRSMDPKFLTPMLLLLAWFVCGLGILASWLVLLYATHADVRRLTGGSYTISPAQAVGFSFIPGFSAFWIVYMPYRLAGAIELQAQASGGSCSKTPVLAMQIASIPLGLVIPAFAPVMYSLSMLHIQRGLNQVWARSATG